MKVVRLPPPSAFPRRRRSGSTRQFYDRMRAHIYIHSITRLNDAGRVIGTKVLRRGAGGSALRISVLAPLFRCILNEHVTVVSPLGAENHPTNLPLLILHTVVAAVLHVTAGRSVGVPRSSSDMVHLHDPNEPVAKETAEELEEPEGPLAA